MHLLRLELKRGCKLYITNDSTYYDDFLALLVDGMLTSAIVGISRDDARKIIATLTEQLEKEK